MSEKLNMLKRMLVCEGKDLKQIDEYTFEHNITLVNYYVVSFKEFKEKVIKESYKWLYHFYINRDIILEFKEDEVLDGGKPVLDSLLAETTKENANTLVAMLLTTQGKDVLRELNEYFSDDPNKMKFFYFNDSKDIYYEVQAGDFLIFRF